MIYEKSVSMGEVRRCLLCHNGPCSASCPYDIRPDRLLRSMYFDNEVGAAFRLGEGRACTDCAAPCEGACLLKGEPVKIRTILTGLAAESVSMEPLKETKRDLSSVFCGVRLENPFLLSSSVVASSYEMIARAFEMGWAGAAYKTLCDFIPQEASPRFSVLREGEGSFYGFKNIEQLSANSLERDLDIIRRLKKEFPAKALLASVMGRDEEEWARLSRLCEQAGADMIECNLSCPNMEEGGLGCDVGQDPGLVRRFTSVVSHAVDIPVLAKLTPNVADMRPMALAAREGGASGLALINTVKSIMDMNLDTYASSPSVRGRSSIGGYSGRAVKPIALRFLLELAQCRELQGIPISGMGGIETWRDGVEFLLLGASNVQVTTAVMQYGYRIIDDLLEGLSLYMEEKGIDSLSGLVGLGVENVTPLDGLERGSVVYPRFLRNACAGCGRCFLACRDGGHQAIEMRQGHPILNPLRCVGCHLCVGVCSQGAVVSGKRHTIPLTYSGDGKKIKGEVTL